MMHRNMAVAFACTALLCTPAHAGPQAKAEAAIRVADQDWLRVFAAKDMAKSVDACAEDGQVLAPNAPRAVGRAAIGDLFKGFFALPNFTIAWTPSEAHVVKSGELGYSSGAYRMSFSDPSGKTVPDHGKYVTIWRREHGKWKVALDMFNTDVPEP